MSNDASKLWHYAVGAGYGVAPIGYAGAGGIPLGYAVPGGGGQPAMMNYYAEGPQYVVYAGFWIRVGAVVLDSLILAVPNFAISAAVGFIVEATGNRYLTALASIGQTVMAWLYYALMESSAKQATLGKMACGIIVTDLNGGRISFGRATGRHFASMISGIIIGIGYLMAAWTQKKQTLHDLIASTVVVPGKR